MLKALAGPFPDVAFCPTGGITVETAPQFLALPNVKVCGGSWLTPPQLVDAKDWSAITAWPARPDNCGPDQPDAGGQGARGHARPLASVAVPATGS